MPQDITDVDEFTDPVQAPADGDALNAASIVPTAIQRLANRTRNLANRTGGGDGTSEWAYDDAPRERVQVIAGSRFQLVGTSSSNSDWYTPGSSARSRVNSSLCYLDLSRILPADATLTRVRAMVKPGAARASGNRMGMKVTVQSPNFAGPSPGSPLDVFSYVYDDGTTNTQVLDSGVISQTVNANQILELIVGAGNDASTNNDELYAVELTFNDLGPRNH